MIIDYNIEPPRQMQQFKNRFKNLDSRTLEKYLIYTLSSIGIRDDEGRGWAVVFADLGAVTDLLALRIL